MRSKFIANVAIFTKKITVCFFQITTLFLKIKREQFYNYKKNFHFTKF
jgi:hypothetical protein